MYGDAIGISYILDPVLLGKDMLDEHNIRAEDSLFESVSRGIVITDKNREQYETKKEQLFVEYTDWVIKATSERIKNDFRYKMLSKRTKTSIQYWLVDGLPFPTLREVAICLAWSLQVLLQKEVFQQWDLSIQNFATDWQQTKFRNWFLSRTMHHS